jgi:hypothetical protein
MADPPKIATDFAPIQQPETADDFVPVVDPGQGKVLSNAGTDDPWGRTKNVATNMIKGALSLPAIAGELNQSGKLLAAGVKSLWDPRSHQEIMKDWDQGLEEERKLEVTLARQRAESLRKAPDSTQRRGDLHRAERRLAMLEGPFKGGMPTTQDVYDQYVKPHLGEYEPQTPEGRIGAFAAQAATPGLAFSKFSQGPRVLSEAPTLAARAIDAVRGVRPALLGAGAGTAAGAAEETWHNPFITTGTAMAMPAALETGVTVAGKKGLLPRTREDAARAAGKTMVDDITAAKEDPAAVLKTAEETYANLPGWHTEESTPTIAEAGKSKALAQSELAASGDPNVDAQLAARGKARNETREKAARDTVDPLAKGDEPGAHFRQFLDDLDERVDRSLPETGTAEETGAAARKTLEQGRSAAEEARTKLYDDMEERFGDQKLLIPQLKENAKDLTKHKPGYTKKRAPDEHTQMALDMPDEVSFGDLRAYLRDVNKEISLVRGNPNKTAELGQLKRLKGGVMDDMQEAVANWAKKDTLDANGKPLPVNEWAAGLQRQQDAFYAARDVAQRATGTGADAAGRSTGVPGMVSTELGAGPERGGPAGAGNAGGVSGGPGRVDAEAAKALKAANDAQIYLGETYRQGAPGQLLKENGFKGNWNITDSKVPRTAFPGGPDGYNITKSVLKAGAGEPQMVQALKDTAIMSLRDAMEGGRLSPKALASWQKKYATSLRALDEVSPGFSDQFKNLANTQSAMAAKFVGAGGDVREAANFMGNILNKTDGASQLRHLVSEAGGEPAVIEGFKKLIIDHMANEANTAKGPGDWGLMMRRQLAKYENVMKVVFGDEHMQVMKQLAEDIQSQQHHANNQRNTGPGSPTAHRLQLMKQRFQEPSPQPSNVAATGKAVSLFDIMQGGFTAENLGKLAGFTGYDYGANLLQRMRARGIHTENELYKAGLVDPHLGLKMLRHGVEGSASPTWLHRVGEGLSLSPLYAQPGLEEEEKRRKSRASGGRISDLAGKLIKAVDHARKLDTTKTKPLLQQDDSTVAHALAIAGKHI